MREIEGVNLSGTCYIKGESVLWDGLEREIVRMETFEDLALGSGEYLVNVVRMTMECGQVLEFEEV